LSRRLLLLALIALSLCSLNARAEITRLARTTQLANVLEFERRLLAPRPVIDKTTQLKWQTRTGSLYAEVQLTAGVEYYLSAVVEGNAEALEISMGDADGKNFSNWQSAVKRRGSKGSEFSMRTPAAGTRMRIRLRTNSPCKFTSFQLREGLQRSTGQLVSPLDADLHAIVRRRTEHGAKRVLQALLASGTTNYEWQLNQRTGQGTLEFEYTVLRRHGEDTAPAGPIEISVELSRGGGWRQVFKKICRTKDRQAWQKVRIPLEGSNGLRLRTRPLDQNTVSLTLAWGNPSLFFGKRKDNPDVVIFTLDALRPDRIGAYGSQRGLTPILDNLAQSGAVFEEARTARGQTWESLTAVALSRWPEESGVVERGQLADRGLQSIADVFSDAGYVTAKLGYYLLPTGHLGQMDIEEDTTNDLMTLNRIKAFLAEERRAPFMLWVHFAAAHYPYFPEKRFLPEGKTGIGRKDFARLIAKGLDDKQRQHLLMLYEACISQTNDYLGQLIPQLTAAKRPGGPALMAFLADHGAHLGESGLWFMHSTVNRSVLHVPLIFHGPGISAKRVDRLVRTLDVGPTLLDYAGLPSGGFSGKSLRALLEGRPEPGRTNVVRLLNGQIVCLENDRFKMVANPQNFEQFWFEFERFALRIPGLQLYAWRNDPKEARNLAASAPLIVGEMWRQIAQGRSTVERPLSSEVRRLLEQAGYLEAGEKPAAEPSFIRD